MRARETIAADPKRLRALRRALAFVLLGGTAIVAAHDWAGASGAPSDVAIDGVLYDVVVVGAALACWLRATVFPGERLAWILLGAGIAAWAGGEIYWTAAIEQNPSPPYPSPADIGYLLFYPLAGAGLLLLVRARASQLDWQLWIDGLIAGLGTAALGAAFVFDFVAARTEGSTAQMATTLAYPLGDIAMMALVVGVIALTRWQPGRSWSLLLTGLAALVVADVAYTLQTSGAGLPEGDWINPIYLLAAVCLGAEAWRPHAAEIEATARHDDLRELMVPAFFGAVMIGLFAMQYFSASSALSTVLWAATMVAVIGRLGVSVQENRRLLEQVQTDPLTGLGNKGRMQVDLDRLCAGATEERPVSLIFLDLNGFKRYNDTRGHPAGDVLLVQLGRELREAVGAEGTAYRIGGDEFCVLLICPGERSDALAREAAKALSAKGPGFDVTAAWGAVEIPTEARDASEALQLADVRMYAQKESRRLTGERHRPDASVKVSTWPEPTKGA